MSMTLGTSGVLTVPQFRTLMPAFGDSGKYLDDQIAMYLQLSASMLDPNRWYDWRPLGMALMVAHWMSLDAREAKTAAAGGIPGQSGIGILSSKSIGSVSAGYDMSAGTERDAGNWNLTTFGRRYIHMARLVGAGGVQITGVIQNPEDIPDPNSFNGPIF